MQISWQMGNKRSRASRCECVIARAWYQCVSGSWGAVESFARTVETQVTDLAEMSCSFAELQKERARGRYNSQLTM
eukprot:2200811-Pleurochrysis_carterae.AAC.2